MAGITTGLIARWKLDEASGNTAADATVSWPARARCGSAWLLQVARPGRCYVCCRAG